MPWLYLKMCLHLAIPTLETLHKAWSSHAKRHNCARFVPVLKTATEKLDEYYEKMTDSPAYIVAMRRLLLSIMDVTDI